MNISYGLARVVAAFLGFTSLVGVIWFGALLGSVEFLGGLILGLTSLAVAIVPMHRLNRGKVCRTVTFLCAMGVVAGMTLVATNVIAPYPVEWDVVVINLLNVGALVAIASVGCNRRSRIAPNE